MEEGSEDKRGSKVILGGGPVSAFGLALSDICDMRESTTEAGVYPILRLHKVNKKQNKKQNKTKQNNIKNILK